LKTYFSVNRLIIITLLIGVLFFLSHCSTKKNTPINRAYHTVTSHYNINFNGKEALKAGEKSLYENVKDNYTTILPIYPYPAKEELSSSLSSFNRAIEKASKSIYKHSIFIKGKEYVRTMDDAYLLMGKAYFHKQDYMQAQRVFSYIISTHKKGNCKEEAMIWLVRSYVRQSYFPRAEAMLNEAHAAIIPLKSKKYNRLFHAAAAEYYLTAPDGDKQMAIDHILDVLKNKPSKKFRNRLYFILGQLYESMELTHDAHQYFLKVIKGNPSYELEFNARMHLASNYDGTPASKAEILKVLNKMLKEEKNREFRDQIYYAISEIARIDEDQKEQIKNLRLSVSTSTSNDFQRSYSALKLADIYFNSEMYPEAQAYYDTATVSLPRNYPNYSNIIKKNKILTDLVTNLNVIYTQDSLQRIAALSPSARTVWVNNMVNNYIRKENEQKKAEADKELAIQRALGMANVNVTNPTSTTGKWYFYNPTLVTAGRTEFIKKWGTRKLEDNWRVSNKQQISFDDLTAINEPANAYDDDDDDSDSTRTKRENDPKKPAFYLQDLPLTAAAKDSSDGKIANAMYNAALIYLDLLGDKEKGNNMLEKLIQRYPKHQYAAPSLYLLYLNYSKDKNPKAEEYKNIILSQYPNSDFAKLIIDPKYNEKLLAEAEKLKKKYEETYIAYSNKQWTKTVALADEALPVCNDSLLKPKFLYLRAIAIGQTEGEKTLKEEMLRITSLYPKSEVAGLARLFLDQAPSSGTKSTSKLDEKNAKNDDSKELFVVSPQEQHFLIMLVNVHKIKSTIQDIKGDIAAFNREFYSLLNINISSIYINQNEQMLTLAKFKNKETALEYYHNIIESEKFYAYNKTKAIVTYVISASNYTSYYNHPDERHLYESFFKQHYLNDDK
jgi:TolA-binding protein